MTMDKYGKVDVDSFFNFIEFSKTCHILSYCGDVRDKIDRSDYTGIAEKVAINAGFLSMYCMPFGDAVLSCKYGLMGMAKLQANQVSVMLLYPILNASLAFQKS